MAIKTEVIINAPREKVWEIITDIKNSSEFITGINKIEILEDPGDSLLGLKWEETRTMFGQTATEVMWITDLEENRFYKTRAERPNVVYISTLSLEEVNGNCKLTMEFDAEISSIGTKVISAVMGIFFNGPTRKAMQQDLEDIKSFAEGV